MQHDYFSVRNFEIKRLVKENKKEKDALEKELKELSEGKALSHTTTTFRDWLAIEKRKAHIKARLISSMQKNAIDAEDEIVKPPKEVIDDMIKEMQRVLGPQYGRMFLEAALQILGYINMQTIIVDLIEGKKHLMPPPLDTMDISVESFSIGNTRIRADKNLSKEEKESYISVQKEFIRKLEMEEAQNEYLLYLHYKEQIEIQNQEKKFNQKSSSMMNNDQNNKQPSLASSRFDDESEDEESDYEYSFGYGYAFKDRYQDTNTFQKKGKDLYDDDYDDQYDDLIVVNTESTLLDLNEENPSKESQKIQSMSTFDENTVNITSMDQTSMKSPDIKELATTNDISSKTSRNKRKEKSKTSGVPQLGNILNLETIKRQNRLIKQEQEEEAFWESMRNTNYDDGIRLDAKKGSVNKGRGGRVYRNQHENSSRKPEELHSVSSSQEAVAVGQSGIQSITTSSSSTSNKNNSNATSEKGRDKGRGGQGPKQKGRNTGQESTTSSKGGENTNDQQGNKNGNKKDLSRLQKRRKEANKSKMANHNRKAQAYKKMDP